MMQDDREEILAALQSQPAAAPAAPHAIAAPPPLPTVPAAQLSAAFMQAVQANQAQVRLLESASALPAAVAAYLQQAGVAAQAVCEERFLPLAWEQAGIAISSRRPHPDDVCGITGVDAAAASHGMVLLSDETPHRLTLSLLPPYYVAVVAAADIAADLPALWQRLPQPLPRGCVLAGGPSRTADIEQTLTLGAHGPKGVLVAVLQNAAPR